MRLAADAKTVVAIAFGCVVVKTGDFVFSLVCIRLQIIVITDGNIKALIELFVIVLAGEFVASVLVHVDGDNIYDPSCFITCLFLQIMYQPGLDKGAYET